MDFHRMIGIALVLAAVACTDGEGPEPNAGDIPAALQTIEGDAEDAYDKALVSDFAAVEADAARLDSGWSGFRAQAIADGASEMDVAALDQAVAGLSEVASGTGGPVAVARAANAVSARMDELFAVYHPVVPPVVIELDYLGREVSLDGRAFDAATAAQHMSSLRSAWQGVKADILAAGGEQVAADYEASLDDADTAITTGDGATLTQRADAGLELVDAMEQLF